MSSQLEIKGISDLKTASLISIVSAVLSIPLYLITRIAPLLVPTIPSPMSFRTIAAQLPLVVLLLAISLALGLAYIVLLRRGFSSLVRAGRNAGVGVTGTSLYVVGLVLVFLGVGLIILLLFVVLGASGRMTTGITAPQTSILTSGTTIPIGLPSSNVPVRAQLLGPILGGVVLLVVGALLSFVGEVLVLVAFFNLGSYYSEGLVKVGAILTIIPFVNVVAPFLLYFGLGNVQDKLRATPQPGRPVVYQLGGGTVGEDGVARVKLYSSRSVSVTSVRMWTTSGIRNATSVNPAVLQPGENYLEVGFGPLPGLPRGTYTLELTLSDGEIVRIFASY